MTNRDQHTQEMLDCLSVDVQESRLLKKEPTQIYLVSGKDGKFLLRIGKQKPKFKKWVGSQNFVNHLSISKALQSASIKGLHIPTLVDYRGWEFMLIQYLDDAHSVYPGNKTEIENVAQSLLAFQTSDIQVQRPLYHQILWMLTRRSKNILTRSAISLLRLAPYWDRKRVKKGFEILLRVKRFPRPFWVHRDFSFKNILIDGSSKVYLLDFELACRQRTGILVDTLEFSIDIEKMTFDKNFLAASLFITGQHFGLTNTELANELRAAILRKLLKLHFSRSTPSETKQRGQTFMLDVLFQDRAYENWFAPIESDLQTMQRQ